VAVTEKEPRDRIFLSGFMAAGKTAVGRELARLLGARFIDLDERIEETSGRTIEQLFAADGEGAFRRLETDTLQAVCRLDGVVVALGGGTVVRRQNRDLIRSRGTLVWLNTPRSTILDRLESGESMRPLYQDAAQVERLLESRLEQYRDCDLEIRPLPGESAEQVALRLARELG
jgi:shikimate kinase